MLQRAGMAAGKREKIVRRVHGMCTGVAVHVEGGRHALGSARHDCAREQRKKRAG